MKVIFCHNGRGVGGEVEAEKWYDKKIEWQTEVV